MILSNGASHGIQLSFYSLHGVDMVFFPTHFDKTFKESCFCSSFSSFCQLQPLLPFIMSQTITTVTTITTGPASCRQHNKHDPHHDSNHDLPHLPRNFVPLVTLAKARKLPICYTDDHHDVIITFFFENRDLYYNHCHGNSVSSNGALAQLCQHLLDQIATLGLTPILEELLTEGALLEKWGCIQRDMVCSPIRGSQT